MPAFEVLRPPRDSRSSLHLSPSSSLRELLHQLNFPGEEDFFPSQVSSNKSLPPTPDTSSRPRSRIADVDVLPREPNAQMKSQGSLNSLSNLSDISGERRLGFALWDEEPGVPVAYASSASSQESVHPDPCTACGDPIDFWDSLLAPCGHLYCKTCVLNLISAYTNDESLHPLRCCKAGIPVSEIETILCDDTKDLSRFKAKQEEYITPFDKRTYCPERNCGQFIKPPKSTTVGRWVSKAPDTAPCPGCSVSVCLLCKELAHPGEKCEVNKNTARLHELAKEKEWQTCSNCQSIVEKIEGCLHMICRCGFEFCYRCGEKYTGPGMCGH